MKAVILAGGFGTRISEESGIRPKPMIEIGGKPILWHIMKIFSAFDVNDFIICCGYKAHVIKEYFANYFLNNSDVTFDFKNNKTKIHNNNVEPWTVTLVDTGENVMTGGRIKRVRKYIGNDTFFLTYGDGVSDIHIGRLIEFHKMQNTFATVTAVQPPGRFGTFTLGDSQTKISSFREKPKGDGAWVNGGFFVLEPKIMEYIDGDHISWEREPLTKLAHDGQLSAYKHYGIWQPMDTLRDKNLLEDMWNNDSAPWKVWKD